MHINYRDEEKRLAAILENVLAEDFFIIKESEIRKNPGKFNVDEVQYKVVPDLIIRPKEHLILNHNFIDSSIPIEIKKFGSLETNKFEDLMFQCHSYRFSEFDGQMPRLCLYFIENYFEYFPENTHLKFDYYKSNDSQTPDYFIKRYIKDKIKIETLFGRMGIGELIVWNKNYTIRLKRQVLFSKIDGVFKYKPAILNFWWGNKGNSKKIN